MKSGEISRAIYVLLLLGSVAIAERVLASSNEWSDLASSSGLQRQIPKGMPAGLWRKSIPKNNPMTAQKIALGEKLYFDKRLSAAFALTIVCHLTVHRHSWPVCKYENRQHLLECRLLLSQAG